MQNTPRATFIAQSYDYLAPHLISYLRAMLVESLPRNLPEMGMPKGEDLLDEGGTE